jgi:hypothetical protein
MFWFDESLSNNFFIFEWPLRGVHKYRYYVHPTGVSVSELAFDDPVWKHSKRVATTWVSGGITISTMTRLRWRR